VARNKHLNSLKVADNLVTFLDEGTLSDITLRADGAAIKAHKIVLATRSRL